MDLLQKQCLQDVFQKDLTQNKKTTELFTFMALFFYQVSRHDINTYT